MTALPDAFVRRALALGFTRPFVASLPDWRADNAENLAGFIEAGYSGDMTWMEETQVRRSDPRRLWPEAQSAIVLGMNYGPDDDPLYGLMFPDTGNISVYARGRDYHDVMKGRLKELAGLLARDLGAQVKVFVDTAPLMEKPLAAQAGLGWQGKHTNLVSQTYGSWLFIGTILTDAPLTPGTPERDHCGSCRACLDICPTDAFAAPYVLDARRCISYLTIEHSGPVPPELRGRLGNRIYGCDDCLAVCPWNKFAKAASEAKFHAGAETSAPKLRELAALDDAAFRARFSGSPIKRIGWPRFLRNVLYAIGNSADAGLKSCAQNHINHSDAVVADAARWAVQKLSSL